MKKQKIISVILSVFFGNIGLHHAYIGNYRLAFTYAIFSTTGLPGLLGIVEAFLMPSRIEKIAQNNEFDRFDWIKFILFPLMGLIVQAILLIVLLTLFIAVSPQSIYVEL